MANAVTNSTASRSIPLNANITLVEINLTIPGTNPHTVFMMARFNAFFSGSSNASIIGNVLVDDIRRDGIQLPVPDGSSNTQVLLFSTLNVTPGIHKFELSAYATGLGSTSVRVVIPILTVIDLN